MTAMTVHMRQPRMDNFAIASTQLQRSSVTMAARIAGLCCFSVSLRLSGPCIFLGLLPLPAIVLEPHRTS